MKMNSANKDIWNNNTRVTYTNCMVTLWVLGEKRNRVMDKKSKYLNAENTIMIETLKLAFAL